MIAPSSFVMQTNLTTVMNATSKQVGTATGVNNGSLKHLTIPSQMLTHTAGTNPAFSGATDFQLTIPRYYKTPTVKPGAHYTGSSTAYPIATTKVRYINNTHEERLEVNGEQYRLHATTTAHSYGMYQSYWVIDSTKTRLNGVLSRAITDNDVGNSQPSYYTTDDTMYYFLENRRITENFVDATGAKITPPTGFTQGKQTVIDSSPYTFKQSGTLPDTYTSGGKTYKFKGWYKGTDKTALKTTKTPSYAVTYDDKDDMTAVYEEVQATAEMTVNRLLEVVPNEASMIWTVRLKNTSEVPLTNVKLAPTAKWAAGISAPTQLAVRISNTPNKIIPVTAEQWRTGVNLGVEIPVNGEALVTVNTAKITGEPRQLLTAEMTASNFVRIQGEDQTITPAPAEEGFISTPTFDFGKITISSSAKQYGLKKAADYYGNGTRNPYLRIKKSQPNWQLTAQLSQLKASADSLPTSTRLLLGNADVVTIENYNQVTELTNKVGITEPLALTSDGTSTPVILNNQFTGNDVYQLEFDFVSVKLEVPANQGKINEKYQGTATWNLVTGP